MQLSDVDLQAAMHNGHLVVDPYDPDALQPASVDLRLGEHFQIQAHQLLPGVPDEPLSPQRDPGRYFDLVSTTPSWGDRLILDPGRCALGVTMERIALPLGDLAARVEGKSSVGRLFVAVHVTAGFIDPGFSGHITLELVNHGSVPVELHPGMRIAQLTVHQLTSGARRLYGHPGLGSRYQDQPAVPVVSRAHLGDNR